jgi:hypothetical protein
MSTLKREREFNLLMVFGLEMSIEALYVCLIQHFAEER